MKEKAIDDVCGNNCYLYKIPSGNPTGKPILRIEGGHPLIGVIPHQRVKKCGLTIDDCHLVNGR